MSRPKQNRFTFYICLVTFLIFLIPSSSHAYGDCTAYGYMANYDPITDTCKCASGYVFSKNFAGNLACVSGSSICYDKYGYSSTYNSVSGSCECSYGYVLGKDSIGRTQCISKDQSCKNQYGYNAKSTYVDKCECNSGYEFTKTISGGLECQSCFTKYGLNSSYDYLSKQCGCDDGYTLKDGQCVQKQNNVYFTLKQLDTDNRKAVVKSEYDYRYYLISYNSGCYSSSFRRYLNHQIVINLGTDFDLDRWDKIVLQDDRETCDISSRERVDSDFSIDKGEESVYIPIIIRTSSPTPQVTKSPAPKTQATTTPNVRAELKCKAGYAPYKTKCIKMPLNAHAANDGGKNAWLCDDGYVEKGNYCIINTPTPSPIATPITPTKINRSFWSKLKFW